MSAVPPLRRAHRRAAGQQANGSLADVTTPDPAHRRVLIAEDEALIRLDLKEMLEEEGYDVCGEAGDGETAVTMARELRPELVILDVQMPVLDGITAAGQIAGERIAPVVILTAFSQRDLVERARDAGAVAYLVKPFQKKDLLPTIEMALSRFNEIVSLEAEVSDLSGRLEARKVIERARDAGAMAYLVKPFQKKDLLPTIEMALSRFNEIVSLEAEVGDLQGRLEARKTIERAKGVLQTEHGFSEPEAFRWIQRTSMNRRSTMKAVAESVLAGEDVPAPAP